MFLKNYRGTVITVVIALVMGFFMTIAAIIIDKLSFHYSSFYKIWAMISHTIVLVSLFVPYKAWGNTLAKTVGCREDSTAFKLISGIIPSLVLNTCITVMVSAANILYNEMIPAEAQIEVWVSGMVHDWPITFVVSYVISFLAEYIGEKTADRMEAD